MARRVYSDQDRALIFAELTINEGNVKRSARNLDIPISTVRYFKAQWDKDGLQPAVAEALPIVIEDFAANAERVRDKLLIRLEELVDDGKITAREIVPALGMLQDKIRAVRGLDSKKVEHKFELPEPEQIRNLFGGVIQELVGAAQDRAAEIDDAEWEPVKDNVLTLPTVSERR